MAMTKRRRKKSTSAMPARRRRTPRLSAAKPVRRRRSRRKSGMLSAGTDYKQIGMQVAFAAAGGVAGVALRNSIPDTMSDYMKAGITVAAGVAVAMITKQPMIGAGMIGTGAALATRKFGQDNQIKVLSEQTNSGYGMLSEAVEIYADENGNPLRRMGDQFYYSNGQMAPYTPSMFMTISA
jgi:hypothetical protein